MAACDHRAWPDAPCDPAEVLYLYCLARRAALSVIDGLGVDDHHALSLVPFEDVVAVVSAVSAGEFCGPSAEARMKDLSWVGFRVCRHHEVVERALRHSPIVPMPFAVLFSCRERLNAWLEGHRNTIAGALERFANHQEWAVKGTMDRGKTEACWLRANPRPHGEAPAGSLGARYLRERGARAARAQALDTWLQHVCLGTVTSLLEDAADFREREVTSAPSEAPGVAIVNWAFLVSQTALDRFVARIASINAMHAEGGLTLSLSGPWPPYSFAPSLEPQAPE